MRQNVILPFRSDPNLTVGETLSEKGVMVKQGTRLLAEY